MSGSVLMGEFYVGKPEKKHRINYMWKNFLYVIIITMVISKCYFCRENIAISYTKNSVNIELGKTNRLKARYMMQNHTCNKQTMCQ